MESYLRINLFGMRPRYRAAASQSLRNTFNRKYLFEINKALIFEAFPYQERCCLCKYGYTVNAETSYIATKLNIRRHLFVFSMEEKA